MKAKFKLYIKTFFTAENGYQKIILFAPQNKAAIDLVGLYNGIPVSYFTDRFEPCYIFRFYE